MDVLKEAWENARSIRPGTRPPGIYVGSIERLGKTYHFYRTDAGEYFYNTDYDRQQEAEEKERRRRRWRQAD